MDARFEYNKICYLILRRNSQIYRKKKILLTKKSFMTKTYFLIEQWLLGGR